MLGQIIRDIFSASRNEKKSDNADRSAGQTDKVIRLPNIFSITQVGALANGTTISRSMIGTSPNSEANHRSWLKSA